MREGETIRESGSEAEEESKSMIERDGDRKERLGCKAVTSSEHSPISGATKRSEAQVLAFPLFLSHSLSLSVSCHVPPLPAAVYFKPFLQRSVSNKPEIPANTSYP